ARPGACGRSFLRGWTPCAGAFRRGRGAGRGGGGASRWRRLAVRGADPLERPGTCAGRALARLLAVRRGLALSDRVHAMSRIAALALLPLCALLAQGCAAIPAAVAVGAMAVAPGEDSRPAPVPSAAPADAPLSGLPR